ncbi:MAG: 5-formyltetrahydrofolate cyclo-ligase [Clostridiales bacterium 38-18]|nr:MAG: 5-formyltetrahydrofolate cyclo-ligase [Clostridiales bacterium 38-18]
MNKRQIRTEILDRRNQMRNEQRELAEATILKSLTQLKEFNNAHTIASFVSFRNEIEMRSINASVLGAGKKLVLPLIDMTLKTMTFHAVSELDTLVRNSYGILEPNPTIHEQVGIDAIDLILTPGVAFDQSGYRLGYGGGFYDRFFSELKKATPSIGIAFECQVVVNLPIDAYDQKIHGLLTEAGLRYFNQ